MARLGFSSFLKKSHELFLLIFAKKGLSLASQRIGKRVTRLIWHYHQELFLKNASTDKRWEWKSFYRYIVYNAIASRNKKFTCLCSCFLDFWATLTRSCWQMKRANCDLCKAWEAAVLKNVVTHKQNMTEFWNKKKFESLQANSKTFLKRCLESP